MIGFLLPILAYTEVHYKWKWLPSRIFMKKPEVIADLPTRIQPNSKLPILCIIKDAVRFPTILIAILVTIKKNGRTIREESFEFDRMEIRERFWSKVFSIDLPPAINGKLDVAVTFELIDDQNKGYQVVNDNLKGLPPLALSVEACEHKLPELSGWHYGDFHTHSEFTDDKVEFGAPIKDSAVLSAALGLEFFVVSDHSYNLDNSIKFPFQNDSDLPRWNALKNMLNEYKPDGYSIPIGAEEVSCGNEKDENVHLLVLNSPRYIPGNGDSEDNYPDINPTISIGDALDLMGDEAVAVAAHPLEKPPLGQKVLFNRGYWSKEDLLDERITGLQILNGLPDRAFYDALDIWKELLLDGHKKIILAGNDAHGNFNKFRQIRIPFISMHQHEKQLFGQVRTALKYEGETNSDSVLKALNARRAQITTGPISDMTLFAEDGKESMIGDEADVNSGELQISAVSTEEFGKLANVVIILGTRSARKESVILQFNDFKTEYEFYESVPIKFSSSGYIRMETFTDGKNKPFSMTNPIWINI